MKEEHRKIIEEFVGKMQCPEKFKCAESGFENLCKAKDFGLDGYLECLEDNPSKCLFALRFGNTHYCKCPLRVYLAKEMNI